MSIVYDIIFALFALFYIPFLIIRGKWHSGFKMRFGCLSPVLVKEFENKECLWIHAVSVGEALAVTGLIESLRSKLPRYKIICSTVTKTGYKIACETLDKNCTVIYAPLDFSWITKKFVSAIRPKIYISTETEIWPNLYRTLKKNGIPIIQINGRISDKAFKGYRRAAFLMKRILSCVDLFYMQSAVDADRIKKLGAPIERVYEVGNLKFDNVPESRTERKEDLGFNNNDDLFIAGSTHPGEEDILIDIYNKLEKEFLKLRMVIAPRHIERVDEIIRLIEARGYRAVRFSQIHENNADARSIIVVDSMGHLRTLYSLSKIVFVGKSLTAGGGQNMIEPACSGKPTIVGPLTQNFKDVVKIFLRSNALIQVQNADELLSEIRNLLTDSDRTERIGKAAEQTAALQRGATSKTVSAIIGLLEQSIK